MVYSLFGLLAYINDNSGFFVIQCEGIGFKCRSDLKTIESLGSSLNSKVKVFTKMNVRENACELFGFTNLSSIALFGLLTSVSGVGPKAALSILSAFRAEDLFNIIETNSIETLTQANGIGERMSKRILLELKGKIKGAFDNNSNICNNNRTQVLSALEVLGYSKNEIFPILDHIDPSLSVENSIKEVLKCLGG